MKIACRSPIKIHSRFSRWVSLEIPMDIEIGIRFDVQSKKAFCEHEHAQKLAKFEAKKKND